MAAGTAISHAFYEFHAPFLAQSPATGTRSPWNPARLRAVKPFTSCCSQIDLEFCLALKSNQDMRVSVSLCLAAPIAVMASIALLPIKAHAAFVFANPAGFPAQGSAPQVYDFLGTGDLSVTAPFQGSEISFGTTTLDFGTAGTNNPAWTGGVVQPMFRIIYGGSRSGGPKELAQLDFTFTNLLSSQSYMVFSDFDSYEGLAIAAFDQTSTLIPFANLTFSRMDGEMSGGASLTTPTWTDTNPTQGWATNNSPWVGASSVSGFLQDATNVSPSLDNPAVALQANTDISRVVFYYNAESISGTSSNTLRFNFAAPSSGPGPCPSDQVPGPLPVLGIFAAFAFSRKLGQRINRA